MRDQVRFTEEVTERGREAIVESERWAWDRLRIGMAPEVIYGRGILGYFLWPNLFDALRPQAGLIVNYLVIQAHIKQQKKARYKKKGIRTALLHVVVF